MTTHNLKIDVAPFNDLLSGAKTCEVRNDDRGFEVGDTVHLTCSDGRTAERTINHIQRGYGLPDDISVLSYTRAGPEAPEFVANQSTTKDVERHKPQSVALKHDVPELVRYGLVLTLRGVPDIEVQHSGELVLYAQAAAIIAAKDKENERLREALKPFAAVAELDIGEDEADEDYFKVMQGYNYAKRLTVGDMRKAFAALYASPAPLKEGGRE